MPKTIFYIAILSLTNCAFITTFNDLDEPVLSNQKSCLSKPSFYRVYNFGYSRGDRSEEEAYYRDEYAEVGMSEYLQGIAMFKPQLSPYPVAEKDSLLNYDETKTQNYDDTHLKKVKEQWTQLTNKNQHEHLDGLIVDIYIKSNTRKMIHGSGTGMYGLMMSALTLGIIPSYFTYDLETEVRLSRIGGTSLYSSRMQRDGSQTGSIFLYVHPRHHSLFSEKKPFEILNKWPVQRMVGHQIKESLAFHCKNERKSI